jgi:superfamily I DNA/RNA helicase
LLIPVLQTDLVNLLQQKMQHVTVVGDDAQSIYRFRGAQPGIFEAYKVRTNC